MTTRKNVSDYKGDINDMKRLKLPFKASMRHFYYFALQINDSTDLVNYIALNQWYFDRVDDEIKHQLRSLYKALKKEERNQSGKKNKP